MKYFSYSMILVSSLSVVMMGCSDQDQNTPGSLSSLSVPAPQALVPVEPLLLRVIGPRQEGGLELGVLLSETRQDLFHRGRADFESVMNRLRVSGSGRPDYVHLNKADVFEAGFQRAQAAIESSSQNSGSLHLDRINIMTSFGLQNSHLLSVGDVHFEHPTFSYTSRWMNYSDDAFVNSQTSEGYQVTFANFANNRLGGGWNTYGNVQEEKMAQECPDFAVILSVFNPARETHQIHTRKNPVHPGDQESARYAQGDGNTADPKLITNLRCFQKLSPFYERDVRDIYASRWNDLSQVLIDRPNAPLVNMIAMAAPELRREQRGRPYTLGLLRDIFDNAFKAFAMVKTYDQSQNRRTHLVLGRWGSGAFGHHRNVSLAVQILAAKSALNHEDRVLFTGLTEEQVAPAMQIMNELLAQGRFSTIDQMLMAFLQRGGEMRWNTQPER